MCAAIKIKTETKVVTSKIEEPLALKRKRKAPEITQDTNIPELQEIIGKAEQHNLSGNMCSILLMVCIIHIFFEFAIRNTRII